MRNLLINKGNKLPVLEKKHNLGIKKSQTLDKLQLDHTPHYKLMI